MRRRPDHRRAAQGHHRGAGAGRPRDVQPQHPAQAAPRGHPGRLLVRRARARRERRRAATETADGRARTFLPLVPAARLGPAADGGGDPAAAPARLHRRRLARRPGRLDPDPLPGWSAPLAGRLRGQLRRPHRDLGRRPGAGRRRTPAGRRQPAPLARAQPAGRRRTTARTTRPDRPVRRASPRPRRPTETPTRRQPRERRRQPARPRRARPGRPGGRAGRPGLAGPARRGDAPRGPGAVAAVRRRRRGRRRGARPAALPARRRPGRHDACRASTSRPPRCCPRRAAT